MANTAKKSAAATTAASPDSPDPAQAAGAQAPAKKPATKAATKSAGKKTPATKAATRQTPDTDVFGGLIGVGTARTVRAPWKASSLRKIREAVIVDLQARGVADETLDEVAVVVSELVTNAFRHAQPLHDNTVRVHWTERNGVVEVDVTDGGGSTDPTPRPQSVFADSGRGLRIVRSYAHEWGVAQKKGGVTVWAAMGGPSRRRA